MLASRRIGRDKSGDEDVNSDHAWALLGLWEDVSYDRPNMRANTVGGATGDNTSYRWSFVDGKENALTGPVGPARSTWVRYNQTTANRIAAPTPTG